MNPIEQHDPPTRPSIAIVDYGMGNLYSVRNACEAVGIDAQITSDKSELLGADGVIIPGVGAFGDAMQTLHRLDLVAVLLDLAAEGRPVIGICLGLQLLMTESEEFGAHRGLNVLSGGVRRLPAVGGDGFNVKVPQVGWNAISAPPARRWGGTVLDGVAEEEFMYFVHSYYVEPELDEAVLSTTRYGASEFCSSVQVRNVFACQFHPERSAGVGKRIYQNIRTFIEQATLRR